MIINEIFESIQGEGKYASYPVLFIRTSQCTRNCNYCDSKFHIEGTEMSKAKIIERILESNLQIVVFTGGEPMLQKEEIKQITQTVNAIDKIKEFHLETNGDILFPTRTFDYVAISPKTRQVAENIQLYLAGTFTNKRHDIKVVTDLELNKDLIPFATMLMPLTTQDKKKNKEIEQTVWNYCVKNNIKFCLRQHIHVWGQIKRGV